MKRLLTILFLSAVTLGTIEAQGPGSCGADLVDPSCYSPCQQGSPNIWREVYAVTCFAGGDCGVNAQTCIQPWSDVDEYYGSTCDSGSYEWCVYNSAKLQRRPLVPAISPQLVLALFRLPNFQEPTPGDGVDPATALRVQRITGRRPIHRVNLNLLNRRFWWKRTTSPVRGSRS